jgi:hypothetical protein
MSSPRNFSGLDPVLVGKMVVMGAFLVTLGVAVLWADFVAPIVAHLVSNSERGQS